MNRAQLAAMTDEQILAYQRTKHGNPYMPLSKAKKLQREEYKWLHLRNASKTTRSEPCRYGEGICLTHSDRET